MSKRVHTKASDWLPIIEQWKESGLNQKLFCEQKNINYKKFYRWQYRLKKTEVSSPLIAKKAPSSLMGFIPVSVSHSLKPSNSLEQSCTLLLNAKLQLQIPVKAIGPGFLRMLFEAAGSAPC
jgi:hypothetical protein